MNKTIKTVGVCKAAGTRWRAVAAQSSSARQCYGADLNGAFCNGALGTGKAAVRGKLGLGWQRLAVCLWQHQDGNDADDVN